MKVTLGLIVVIISFTFVSAMLMRQDNVIRESLQIQFGTKEKK